MVGTTNTITHTPIPANPPITHFTHTGKLLSVMLSVTTVTTKHTENTFTGLRMPRCCSQSRSNFPKNGDRFSHRSKRGDERAKQ